MESQTTEYEPQSMSNEIEITKTQIEQSQDYEQLVDQISTLWDRGKENAMFAVNSELLMANWRTGQYIVELEQDGKAKARYGEQLITNLAKDLTRLRGRGFIRSNLIFMRKLYLTFPKSETLSHQLTWSHYFELLARNCTNQSTRDCADESAQTDSTNLIHPLILQLIQKPFRRLDPFLAAAAKHKPLFLKQMPALDVQLVDDAMGLVKHQVVEDVV